MQGKVLAFLPVSGHINPSDVGTKVLSEKRFVAMLGAQNFIDTVNSDSEIGMDEWSELCAEVGMHVQLRRLNARMKSFRGATAAKRSHDDDDWLLVSGHVWPWRAGVVILALAAFLSLGSGLWMQRYEPFEGATNAQTDAKPGVAEILTAKDPG